MRLQHNCARKILAMVFYRELKLFSTEPYDAYIQHAAVEKWEEKLPQAALQTIFLLSEKHPHYLNKLCSLLWLNDELPTEDEVLVVWNDYVLENMSNIERELELLALNQRKILISIAADDFDEEPLSQASTSLLKMPASTIYRAIEALSSKDYIYKADGAYKILDPLIRAVLSIQKIF